MQDSCHGTRLLLARFVESVSLCYLVVVYAALRLELLLLVSEF
jgi:hypothetical protein